MFAATTLVVSAMMCIKIISDRRPYVIYAEDLPFVSYAGETSTTSPPLAREY